MTDPTSLADTPAEEHPPAPAPLQMLGAADADGCHDGVCAVPAADDGGG